MHRRAGRFRTAYKVYPPEPSYLVDMPGFNYTNRPDIDALQILATERERRISFYIRGSSGRLEKTSTVVLGHPA